MSEKIRRQKDIIRGATQSILDATTQYQDYFDKTSPVYITYYQIADEASRTDTSLEDTHEVVGSQSSLRYCRIKHVPVYGISTLDIMNQTTQRGGVESFISGEIVMRPDLMINPRPGEFFSIEDTDGINPEITTHLFRIDDVQFDRATSMKFYKCGYKLYPLDTDNIEGFFDGNGRQIVKKYIYDLNGNGNTDGVGDSVLITEEEAENASVLSGMIDGLIDKFEELFYNEAMDTFTYQKSLDPMGTEFEYYWSPYLCHFIYKNDILTKSQRDFLTEIYVQDITESEYPGIYNERGYRKSIYYALETGDCGIMGVDASFMEISAYDLNKPLSLPFFTTAERYHLIEVNHPYNVDFWMGAFNWIYEDEDHLLMNVDSKYKYTGDFSEYLINAGIAEISEDTEGALSLNVLDSDALADKTYYEVDGIVVKSMVHIPANSDSDVYECDIRSLCEDTSTRLGGTDDLVEIIRDYFNNNFTPDTSTLGILNNYYYDNSIRTYLLLPIIIYILQHYNE